MSSSMRLKLEDEGVSPFGLGGEAEGSGERSKDWRSGAGEQVEEGRREEGGREVE